MTKAHVGPLRNEKSLFGEKPLIQRQNEVCSSTIQGVADQPHCTMWVQGHRPCAQIPDLPLGRSAALGRLLHLTAPQFLKLSRGGGHDMLQGQCKRWRKAASTVERAPWKLNAFVQQPRGGAASRGPSVPPACESGVCTRADHFASTEAPLGALSTSKFKPTNVIIIVNNNNSGGTPGCLSS